MLPVPLFKFYTYESSHFLIHYHREVEEIVVTVSEIADSVYESFVKIFGYDVGKVNLVILDAYDFSNGFSTPFYEKTIYVFLQNPFADFYFGFGSMRGWLELVISHELTHIFHFEYPHSFWNIPFAYGFRKNFGRLPSPLAFPNIFDPRWQMEGLAIYFESKGGYGRLNSGHYKNLLLAYVRGNRFSPDVMSNSPPNWLGENVPYLFGSFFTKFLVDKYGENYVIERFVKSSYFEDPGFLTTFGLIKGPYLSKDWEDFQIWYENLLKESEEFLLPETVIKKSGDIQISPAISPSGKFLAFIENPSYDYPSLVVLDLNRGREIGRLKGAILPGIQFDGDSSIIFAKYENFKNFFVFSDIFRWEFVNGKIERITQGERAFSPYKKGDSIFFIRRRGLYQEIVLRVGREEKVLYRGKIYEGFNNLKYFDGKLFLSINDDGRYDIGFLDIKSGKLEKLTEDDAVDIFSFADGSGIYFSRDEGDGYRVFLYKDGEFFEGKERFFSAIYPIPYKGRILASFLTPEGYRVGFSEVSFEESKIQRDKRKERIFYHLKPLSKPYKPLPHILPKYWYPYFYASFDTSKFFNLSIISSGGDVLYRHLWEISLNFSLKFGNDTLFNFYPFFSWTYRGTYPFISLSIVGDKFLASLNFPFYGLRSYKGFIILGKFSRDSIKGGIGGYYSNAFSYKKTSFLAEGYTLYAEILYGKKMEEFFAGRFALQIKPFLINLYGYYQGDSAYYEGFLLPNLFKPNFPDINLGILPPPSAHFSSILYLLRFYPSLFYNGKFGYMLFVDIQILERWVFSLGFGHYLYPQRSFRFLVM